MAPRKPKGAATLAAHLAATVAAFASGQAYMATVAEMKPLVDYEGGALVECNEAVKDGDKIAWRPTPRGQEAAQAGWLGNVQGVTQTEGTTAGTQTQPATKSDPSKFVFDDDVPIPEPRRGGRGSNTYGFEHMNVGQSFHIAATTDNPNPAKRVASTVSSATKRMAPKEFMVRSVDETDKKGKGARVFRTA